MNDPTGLPPESSGSTEIHNNRRKSSTGPPIRRVVIPGAPQPHCEGSAQRYIWTAPHGATIDSPAPGTLHRDRINGETDRPSVTVNLMIPDLRHSLIQTMLISQRTYSLLLLPPRASETEAHRRVAFDFDDSNPTRRAGLQNAPFDVRPRSFGCFLTPVLLRLRHTRASRTSRIWK